MDLEKWGSCQRVWDYMFHPHTDAFVFDGGRASFPSVSQVAIWSPSIDRSYMLCLRTQNTNTHTHTNTQTHCVTPTKCSYLLMEKPTHTTGPKETFKKFLKSLLHPLSVVPESASSLPSASTSSWEGRPVAKD